MKQLYLIFTISLVSANLIGQSLGDSVIVYIDNRVEVNIAVPDYSNLKSSDQVILAIEEFQKILPKIHDQLLPGSADRIIFTVGGSLTVEPGDPKITYLITNGEISNTGVRDQVHIIKDEFKVFITTSDVTKISEIPFKPCLERVFDKLPEKTNMSKSLYYQCINQEVVALESKNRTNGKLDFLELNLGAGAGLVKNNWVADLSFQVGLGLVKKGIPKHRPYLSTNVLFDFDDEGSINLNMFLNIGYRPTIVKDIKKSTFLGFEIGYLIVDQGEMFDGTTFKLGANWSPVKGVFVGPQLYATDNFKKVFPGIRIGLGI